MIEHKSPSHIFYQRGSILTVALGAVLMLGVLSYSAYSLLSGPIRSTSVAAGKTKAKSDQQISSRLIMNKADATTIDADTTLEPVAPDAPVAPATAPTGGGVVPSSVGAPALDPWGSRYGYCAWNHGATATASGRMLAGLSSDFAQAISVALISAGPDKIFQTQCVGSGDPSYATNGGIKPDGDDVIESYYYQSTAGSGGGGGGGGGSSLWSKTGSNIQYSTDKVFVGNVMAPTTDLFQVAQDASVGTNLTIATDSGATDAKLTVKKLVLNGTLSVSGLFDVTGTLTSKGVGAGILTTAGLQIDDTGNPLVENLNVQYLDDQDSAYYLDWTHKSGVLPSGTFPTLVGDVTLDTTTKAWTVTRLQGRTIPSPVGCPGCFMVWNGTGGIWEARYITEGDDITGSHNKTVVKIQDRAVSSAAPGANKVLGWNGSAWAPMSVGVTGDANTVQYGGANFLALDTNITSGTCTRRKIPKFNGTNWACATDATAVGTLPVDVDYIEPFSYQRIMEINSGSDPFWSYWGGNTIMGIQAGKGLENMSGEPPNGASNNGDQNTFFGYRAGATFEGTGGNTANRSTMIGAFAGERIPQATMTTLIGYDAGNIIYNMDYNVFIGSEAADSSTSYSKQGVAVGVRSGRKVGGGATPSGLTAVGFETATEASAGGVNSTYIGFQAGKVATGANNTFIGSRAGYRVSSGYQSTVIGSNAWTVNGSTAFNNTIIGSNAGQNASSAGGNVFIGYQAGKSWVNSAIAVAIGYNAARLDNANYGIQIGESVSENKAGDGGAGVVVGQYAAMNSTLNTGYNHSVAIGRNTMSTTDGSTFNLVLGTDAGMYMKDPDYNVVIGAGAAKASSGTKFGSSTNALTEAQENVFIGYNAVPIVSTASLNIIIGANAGAALTSGFGNILIGSGMNLAAGTTSDYLKIGTTRPGVGDVLYGDMMTGNLTLKGTLTAPSDVRLKREIRPLTGALAKINQLNGVVYNWKESFKKDPRDYLGVIAQDVLKVAPQAVFKMGDNPKAKYYTVSYDHLVPLLVEGVKEQEDKLNHLEDKADYLIKKKQEREMKNAQ